MSRGRFDVAVIGGGPAGCAAALAAAREGASVVLLEREARLGGNVANAQVHTICGLFEPESDSPVWLQNGLAREVTEALLERGGALPAERVGRVFVVPIDPRAFGDHLSTVLEKTAGVDIRTQDPVRGLTFGASDDADTRIELRDETLSAAVVIDSSGDAVSATAGGAEADLAPQEELQASSLIVALGGVPASATEGFARLKVTRGLSGAARRGDLPRECESVLIRPGVSPGAAFLTLNLPKSPALLSDGDVRRKATSAGKRWAEQIVEYLRATREDFRDASVTGWPIHVGVRETRRLRGLAHLTEEDVLGGLRRDDEVARSGWPIELWEDHRRVRLRYPTAACSVPLGALVSATHPRLGMAGRCLSATHVAHGALRVVGTALATGEAIGVAGALAARSRRSLADISPATIRERIAFRAPLR